VSAKAADSAPASDKPQGKGRKGLVIAVLAGVLMAAGGAGGAWFFLDRKGRAAQEAGADAHEEPARATATQAPTYLALENMVLNLADPGGDRVAQLGITLELDSDKAVEQIKQLMPKVRSTVLMMVSQRTSDELLKRDGKEKLAADLRSEISGVLGYEVEAPRTTKTAKAAEGDDEPPARKRRKPVYNPVQGVLFTAFIVQ
jgi:flagellar FliL protein